MEPRYADLTLQIRMAPLQKRMGPGAWEHRGALHLRYRRRISGRHQYLSQDPAARGLCAPVLRICSNFWRRNEAGSCYDLDRTQTLRW